VTCRICRQRPDFRAIKQVRLRAAIYGIVPYGLCLCGMEVLPDRNDVNYRRRWKRALWRAVSSAGNQG
jgi:hypothetical protein